jgi:hypothetical protein
MQGIFEKFSRVRLLYDLPCVHDRDIVGALGYEAKVMSHEDHRHAHVRLDPGEQFENMRLDRHIQGGGRLIGQDERRCTGDGHSDHDTLTHAA